MSYEKEVAELWKDWKSSTDKYAEAIEDGYDVDADMWAHDVMGIERQIYVYEQAAKADEYEAKAKLADDIITAWKTGDFDFTEGEGSLPDHGIAPVPNYHMFDFGQYVDSLLVEYESGESE